MSLGMINNDKLNDQDDVSPMDVDDTEQLVPGEYFFYMFLWEKFFFFPLKKFESFFEVESSEFLFYLFHDEVFRKNKILLFW